MTDADGEREKTKQPQYVVERGLMYMMHGCKKDSNTRIHHGENNIATALEYDFKDWSSNLNL